VGVVTWAISTFWTLKISPHQVVGIQVIYRLDRRRFVYDTYKIMKATRTRHGWVHMFITHRPTLTLQLHNFNLFRTCHTDSFCTVAWQLARFQLTRCIAWSLGDSGASCMHYSVTKDVTSLMKTTFLSYIVFWILWSHKNAEMSLNKSYCRLTHTHPFNSPFSGTTRVGRYQKGKTNLDFTEARGSLFSNIDSSVSSRHCKRFAYKHMNISIWWVIAK